MNQAIRIGLFGLTSRMSDGEILESGREDTLAVILHAGVRC